MLYIRIILSKQNIKLVKPSKELLIGAHTSAAGGVHHALHHGKEINATTVQLFTSNQRQWGSKKISEKEIALWEQAREETNIKIVASHDSYLINLGSPKKLLLNKSCKAFEMEIERCHQLKINFLILHPGAATGSTEEECLDTICTSLLSMERLVTKGPTRILLETTAGQGSNVGYCFEHLHYIIHKVGNKIPLGVCMDTCHIFAAGYDIRTKKAWDNTLSEFNKIIGLKHLYVFHVNDSKSELGSRKDRHASLGKGVIGLECFRIMMHHPKMRFLPKYLETPVVERWKEEIALLRKFGKKK